MSTFQSPQSSGPQGSHGQPSGGQGSTGQPGYGPYQGASFSGGPTNGGPYQGTYRGGPYQGGQYQGAPGQQPHKKPPLEAFFNSVRSVHIFRGHPRWIGGVCQALGARWRIDPLVIRLAWIILFFINTGFLLAYGLLWLFLPERQDGRIHAQQLLSGDLSAGLAGSLFCVLMGMSSNDVHVPVFVLDATGGEYFSAERWILITMLIAGAAGVAWLISLSRSKRSSGQGPTPNSYPSMPFPPSPMGGPGHSPIPAPSLDVTDAPPVASTQRASDAGQFTVFSEEGNGEAVDAPPAGSGSGGEDSPGGSSSIPAYFAPYAASAASASAASASGPSLHAPMQPDHPLASSSGMGDFQTYQPYSPYPGPLTMPPAAKVQAPGPSGRLWLLLAGLVFIGISLGAIAVTGGMSTLGTIPIIMGGIALAIGVPLFIAALTHRRGSWMSGLAIVTLICAIPTMLGLAVVPGYVWTAPVTYGTQTVQAFSGDYSFGMGDLHITTSSLPDSTGPITMNVTMAGGSLTIDTSSEQNLQVNVTQNLGELRIFSAEPWKGASSFSDPGYYSLASSTDYEGTFYPNGELSKTHSSSTAIFGHRTFALTSPHHNDSPLITINVTMGTGAVTVDATDGIVQWEGRQSDDVWVLYHWFPHDHTTEERQLPPGITHPVITDEQAAACASIVKGELVETYDEYSEILDFSPTQKTTYTRCAQDVAAHNDLDRGIATYLPEAYFSIPGHQASTTDEDSGPVASNPPTDPAQTPDPDGNSSEENGQ